MLTLNSLASVGDSPPPISYDDFSFLATLLNWESPLNFASFQGESRSTLDWVSLFEGNSSIGTAAAVTSSDSTLPVDFSGSSVLVPNVVADTSAAEEGGSMAL